MDVHRLRVWRTVVGGGGVRYWVVDAGRMLDRQIIFIFIGMTVYREHELKRLHF